MSGPLTFAIYGAWGRLAGFGTAELRLLSPLIASATALVWFAFLRDRLRSCTVVGLALATLVLNPYFIGLSVFVFTDMLALLGPGLGLLGTSRRSGSCTARRTGPCRSRAWLWCSYCWPS